MASRKEIKFSILMGECCQALECGRARYFPSLIALFKPEVMWYSLVGWYIVVNSYKIIYLCGGKDGL